MSNLSDVVKSFNTMRSVLRKSVNLALYREASLLVADFKQRSPVDSGEFKRRWTVSRDRLSSSDLSGVSITNSTYYAPHLEFGVEPNKAPWYFPNKKKRTGKLAVRDGKVWAGGLNPGHSKTVGGAIGAGLFNNERRLDKLVNVIANSVLESFK